MKWTITVLVVLLVQTFPALVTARYPAQQDIPFARAAIDEPLVEEEEVGHAAFAVLSARDDLMSQATDYQNKANDLQNDINGQLLLIRNAVAEVLQVNMNGTLDQTDKNSVLVVDMYDDMEDKMGGLVKDECYYDLIEVSKRFVSLAGYQISNILEKHDSSVTTALGNSNEIIRKFDAIASDVQRKVVQSFIKENMFNGPEKISTKFTKSYEVSKADWDKIRPTIAEIIIDLRSNFNGLLTTLGTNYNKMQVTLQASYNTFEFQAINICEQFAHTRYARAPVPMSNPNQPRTFQFFNPEDILPKFEN